MCTQETAPTITCIDSPEFDDVIRLASAACDITYAADLAAYRRFQEVDCAVRLQREPVLADGTVVTQADLDAAARSRARAEAAHRAASDIADRLYQPFRTRGAVASAERLLEAALAARGRARAPRTVAKADAEVTAAKAALRAAELVVTERLADEVAAALATARALLEQKMEPVPAPAPTVSLDDARARLRRAEAALDAALAVRRDAKGARAVTAADRAVAAAQVEHEAADEALVQLAADDRVIQQSAPAPALVLTADRIPEVTHLEVDDREATGDEIEPVTVKLTPKQKTFAGIALRYVQEAAWGGIAPNTNDGVVITATKRDGTKVDATEDFLATGWARWTELRDYREALRTAPDDEADEALVQRAEGEDRPQVCLGDEDIGNQSDLSEAEVAQAIAEGLETEDELESLTEYGAAALEVTRFRVPGFISHRGNLARRHLRRWAQALVATGEVNFRHPALAAEADGLLAVLADDAGLPGAALAGVRDEMLDEMVHRLRGLWMSPDDDGDDEPPTPPTGGGILSPRPFSPL